MKPRRPRVVSVEKNLTSMAVSQNKNDSCNRRKLHRKECISITVLFFSNKVPQSITDITVLINSKTKEP